MVDWRAMNNMDRSEMALYKEGLRWIKTPTFQKNVAKFTKKYNIYMKTPPMLPVEISKRMTRYYGRCYMGRIIRIAHYHWNQSPRKRVIQTLRHEYLHEWIWVNYKVIRRAGWRDVKYRDFLKEVYHTFGFGGDHNAYKYRYTGNGCQCWQKSNQVMKYWHCQCGKTYLKPSEMKKVKANGGIFHSELKQQDIPVSELGILKKKILISV